MATETVSVELGRDIVSVSGTVNGVSVPFNRTAPDSNIWTAQADKSPSGRYEIVITAQNDLGTTTTMSTVQYLMSDPYPFKTDWKSTDFYNYEDMDRVEANTRFVRDFLANTLKYEIKDFGTAPLRTYESMDYLAGIQTVEDNIETLRQTIGSTPPGYQGYKTWAVRQPFSYKDASRLEDNLQKLYEFAKIIQKSFIYSGTRNTGEGGIY